MNDDRRHPSSWPASLLPTMFLAGLLLAGFGASTSSSSDAPALELTITTGR